MRNLEAKNENPSATRSVMKGATRLRILAESEKEDHSETGGDSHATTDEIVSTIERFK